MSTDTRKTWRILAFVLLASFLALGWMGREIYVQAPPIPDRVVSASGEVLFTEGQVDQGKGAWLAAGGQQVGSVWGHGSYIAPDWSADWLHREAVALRERIALRDFGKEFATLPRNLQAAVEESLKTEMRRNTWDEAAGTITVSNERAEVIRELSAHYSGLFGDDARHDVLREQYAMVSGSLKDPAELAAVPAFFFWSAWAATTDRPGETGVTYTSNWPHEPLVGNVPTPGNGLWSLVSIILLIAGIAGMILYHRAQPEAKDPRAPERDPLFSITVTPSMRATLKYFYVVIGLLLLQVIMGVVSAHYAVEGDGFFGFPLPDYLPFSVSRTIHTQLGVLWIATAWLATGLYISPVLSGHEPKYQKLGVNVLFYALLVIVLGSIATGWVGTLESLGSDYAFWIGNQGLEYTSMGRVWQLGLFAGLLIWLFLVGRALWPALTTPDEGRGLITMVFLSAACIGGFYASSLM